MGNREAAEVEKVLRDFLWLEALDLKCCGRLLPVGAAARRGVAAAV